MPSSQARRSSSIIAPSNEQLAYWINLHNALIVRTVLRHDPIASILDLGNSRAQQGPWDAPMIEVDVQMLSLNDVQSSIVRPIWRHPRALYALSCGALSCPNLQPVPFDAAMSYVNDPRCIRMEDRQLLVSSLFRWYRADFGGSDRAVIDHLMGFAEPGLAVKLQQFDRIDGDVFDWRLNDGTSS